MERVFIDNEFQELIDILQEDRKCGNLIKLKEDATRLKEEAILSGNEYAESIAYYFLAGYWLMSNELTKSIDYCNYVKEKYKKHPFHYIYAMCCNIAGTAHMHLHERQIAIDHYLDGYYISLEHSFFDIQVNILNNIGTVFYALEDHEKALEYYLNAHDVTLKNPSENQKTVEMIWINLSTTYIAMKKFQEAKYWQQKHLDKFGKSNDALIANTILRDRILMIHTAEWHSQLAEEVHLFLDSMKNGWNDLYSLQMIFDVIEICLKQKDIELSKKSIELAESKMKSLVGTLYNEQLASVKIQLYKLTEDEDKLFETLLKYYEIVREDQTTKRQIESAGILSKIHLRQSEYSKRQIELKNKELERLNEIDSFTGLLNKAFFEKKVQDRLNQKIEGQGQDVLLIIDIDNFKQINDTYGHAVGDQVIKELANQLQNKTRYSDYVGRIGGDEFCALLLDIPNMEVIKLWVQNFITAVQSIACDKLNPNKVTVSIGVANSTGENTNLELFEKADQAMYEAKKKGKNTYGIYSEHSQ